MCLRSCSSARLLTISRTGAGASSPRSAADHTCSGLLLAFMICMRPGMRGSLISLTTVTTAGSGASSVSIMSSMLRSQRTAPSAASTLRA